MAEELRSKNLLRNHALTLSIADVGWRTYLPLIPATLPNLYIRGTDKTEKLTFRDREWTCPQCGSQHLRYWNAAQNILAKSLASI